MSTEWCPKCQGVQSMNTSACETIEHNEHGESVLIRTISYTCSNCNLFVRSEEEKSIIDQAAV